MELKAKDGYRSEVLRPLGADALNSLMSLYQPLVGCAGAALYLTLISEAKHQRSFEPHGRLCQIMNMDIGISVRICDLIVINLGKPVICSYGTGIA